MDTIYSLANSNIYGIWFSSSYCSWCEKFTPKLKQFANKSGIPILLCGSDKTEDAYNEYYQKNNWAINIPFDNEYKSKLREIYDIKTIPALIFFNKELILEKNGRYLVQDNSTEFVLDKLNQEVNFDSDDEF